MVVSLITGHFKLAPTTDEEHAAQPAIGWSVTSHLLALSAIAMAFRMMQSYWQRRRRFQLFQQLGIPGPRPNLLMGNADLMRNRSLLSIDVMEQWQAEYGDLYGYYIGQKPYVVVRDLDQVQQVLIKEFHNFVNRPTMNIQIRPVINTLVGLRDQRWKEVRKIISPTLSRRQMRRISSIINCCVDILVEVVDAKVAARQNIEFYGLFQGLTCQVIGRSALDTDIDCQRLPHDRFLHALRHFLKGATNPIIDLAIYFPFISQVLAVICRVFSPCGQFTQSIIDKVQLTIDERRAAATSGHQHRRPDDVLQLLLDAAENHTDAAADEAAGPRRRMQYLLNDDEIVANAWVFLLGGFETTANALTYCSYLIATHPLVQQRLYQELCDHIEAIILLSLSTRVNCCNCCNGRAHC